MRFRLAAVLLKHILPTSNKSAVTTRIRKLSNMATNGNPLDEVEDVVIDDHGKFKYVLIKVYDSSEQHMKHIVRGHAWATWHGDIYDDADGKISKKGCSCECVGGGRIEHQPEKKRIFVYGYSQGYGKADHSIATDLIKKKYKDYTDITWSDDGY